jgi:hypothetical protein
MRGKWVLQNLLGAPPPSPPPGVEVNLEADLGLLAGLHHMLLCSP